MNRTSKQSTKSANSKRISISSPKTASFSRKTARRTRLSRLSAYAKPAILTVIVLSMMAVVLTLLSTFMTAPERVVAEKIASLASDYYENYFYDQIGFYNTSNASHTSLVAAYKDQGFAPVNLVQLTNFAGGRHKDALAPLSEYCDPNETAVRIFPDYPFGRQNYHIEYIYSCKF